MTTEERDELKKQITLMGSEDIKKQLKIGSRLSKIFHNLLTWWVICFIFTIGPMFLTLFIGGVKITPDIFMVGVFINFLIWFFWAENYCKKVLKISKVEFDELYELFVDELKKRDLTIK